MPRNQARVKDDKRRSECGEILEDEHGLHQCRIRRGHDGDHVWTKVWGLWREKKRGGYTHGKRREEKE